MRILVIGNNNKGAMEHFVSQALNSFYQVGHQSFPIIGNNRKLRLLMNYFSLLRNVVYYVFEKKIINYNAQVLIVGYRDFDPKTLKNIKTKSRNEVTLLSLNSDHIANLYKQESFLAPYDLYLVKDKFLFNILKEKLGKKAYYWHESSPDEYLRLPVLDIAEHAYDVISMGSLYPYRYEFMKNFIAQYQQNNCDFSFKCFYSNSNISPKHAFFEKRFIGEDEKEKLTSITRLVINNLHYAEIEGLNMKFWEYAALGVPQLIDYKSVTLDGLGFELELIMFRDVEELLEKIRYYLENYDEILSLTKELRNYVRNNHSYSVKYKKLISEFE